MWEVCLKRSTLTSRRICVSTTKKRGIYKTDPPLSVGNVNSQNGYRTDVAFAKALSLHSAAAAHATAHAATHTTAHTTAHTTTHKASLKNI